MSLCVGDMRSLLLLSAVVVVFVLSNRANHFQRIFEDGIVICKSSKLSCMLLTQFALTFYPMFLLDID